MGAPPEDQRLHPLKHADGRTRVVHHGLPLPQDFAFDHPTKLRIAHEADGSLKMSAVRHAIGKLRAGRLVPQMWPKFRPQCKLHVVWRNHARPGGLGPLPGWPDPPRAVEAMWGNALTPAQMHDAPTVYHTCDFDGRAPRDPRYAHNPSNASDPRAGDMAHFTLLMVDPDHAQSHRMEDQPFVHWLVGNYHDNGINAGEGETLMAYVAPGPPHHHGSDYVHPTAGWHRFVFVLYAQRSGIVDFHEDAADGGMKMFRKGRTYGATTDTYEARQRFPLREFEARYGLGRPVAVQWAQAKWDIYSEHQYEDQGLPRAEDVGRTRPYAHDAEAHQEL
jgi:hypothetical protein